MQRVSVELTVSRVRTDWPCRSCANIILSHRVICNWELLGVPSRAPFELIPHVRIAPAMWQYTFKFNSILHFSELQSISLWLDPSKFYLYRSLKLSGLKSWLHLELFRELNKLHCSFCFDSLRQFRTELFVKKRLDLCTQNLIDIVQPFQKVSQLFDQ